MATSSTDHQNQIQQHDATTINETSRDQVAAIMVPFLAQGHLNQLLQLSCLIASYEIPVYYVGTAVHNRQAKQRVNGINPSDVAKIQFHDIPIPHFASPPPDPTSPDNYPTQLLPAWNTSLNLRQPFAEFLHGMAEKFKRVVVIHDPMMAFVVQDVNSVSNAESYAFNCISAYAKLFLIHQGLQNRVSVEFPKRLASFDEWVPEGVHNLAALQSEPLNYRSGDLYNTCRSIEAPYMDILENEDVAANRKTWAVGPILPAELSGENQHGCLKWLDKHEPNSVMYVSFGTTISLQDEQIKELAIGLEQSKVKFLWVLRDADKGDVFDAQVRRAELPEGFEERVHGVGLVVRDWAPQPQILAHQSTGGFMSHCGWNSCVESVTMGVPIAAWPMHSDQPVNTVFITEVLRMGIVVSEWNQKAELVRASSIENVVKKLMASEEGDGVRTSAKEVGDIVRGATREGGASRVEMNSFIAHIMRSK